MRVHNSMIPVLLFLSLFVVTIVAGDQGVAISFRTHNITAGRRLANASSIGKVLGVSRATECLHFCKMEQRTSGLCSSVNYFEAGNSSFCELNDLHVMDDESNIALEPAESTTWFDLNFGPPMTPSLEQSDRTNDRLTFTWTAGWNGGYEQYFRLEYKQSTDPTFTIVEDRMQDPGEGAQQNATIDGLTPAIEYIVRLTATNTRPFGVNQSSTEVALTTYHPTSCSGYKSIGFTRDDEYIIDPDGQNTGLDPFTVICDMSTDPPMAVFSHDKENPIMLAGMISHEVELAFQITYDNPADQIFAVADAAASCSQFFRRRCLGSIVQTSYELYSYWYGRSNRELSYWGGSDPATGGCGCHKTGTCNGNYMCNCDANNEGQEFVEEGDLTTKEDLPMFRFYQGDADGDNEWVEITVGPLLCSN